MHLDFKIRDNFGGTNVYQYSNRKTKMRSSDFLIIWIMGADELLSWMLERHQKGTNRRSSVCVVCVCSRRERREKRAFFFFFFFNRLIFPPFHRETGSHTLELWMVNFVKYRHRSGQREKSETAGHIVPYNFVFGFYNDRNRWYSNTKSVHILMFRN